MNVSPILTDLERRGIRPILRDGGVKLVGPRAVLTPELIEQVRPHKAALLAMLGRQSREAIPYRAKDCEEAEIDRLARADGWEPPKEIPADVAAEIRRIEPKALALGWPHDRLWNFHFWPHSARRPRGLASVMNPGDRIADVTADYLIVEKTAPWRTDRLPFMRADA